MKKLIYNSIISGLLVSLIFIGISNKKVTNATEGKVYNNTSDIPENYVGLLLGTSKLLKSGHQNPFFVNRIDAAADLYKTGKIKK